MYYVYIYVCIAKTNGLSIAPPPPLVTSLSEKEKHSVGEFPPPYTAEKSHIIIYYCTDEEMFWENP